MSDSGHNKVNGKSVSKLDEWMKQAERDGIINENVNPSKKKYRYYTDEEGYCWVETPRGLKFPQMTRLRRTAEDSGPGFSGGYKKSKPLHERFAETYPSVEIWLKGLSKGTRWNYGDKLLQFCRDQDMKPEEFGDLWKTVVDQTKAKTLATKYIQSIMHERPHHASLMICALKSFFRVYSGGFKLPLDTGKGGALQIPKRATEKRERERFSYGSNDEIREKLHTMIPLMSRDLRDNMMLTFLFRTGIRINSLIHLKMKHVQDRFMVNDPITGKPTEVLCLTVTGEIDSKIISYNFPRLADAPGQPRGYYTYLARDSLELFDKYITRYRANANPESTVFAKYEGQEVDANLRGRIHTRLEKSYLPADKIWPHQFRSCFNMLAHESLKKNRAEMLTGHLLSGVQDAYQRRNKTECAKDYLKIQFKPSVAFLKRRFMEEMQLAKQREEEEIAKKVKEPGFKAEEPIKEESYIESKEPQMHVKIAKEITPRKEEFTFVLGPAPKHCLRGIGFRNARDDSYCHHTCRLSNPDEYKACQDLKNENSELFL